MYLGTICLKIHFSHTKSPSCFLFSREAAHWSREEWITSQVLTLFRLFKVFILRRHRWTVKREDGMVFNRENSKRIDSPFQNGNCRKHKIIGAKEIWNSVGQAMLSLRVWEYFLTPCLEDNTVGVGRTNSGRPFQPGDIAGSFPVLQLPDFSFPKLELLIHDSVFLWPHTHAFSRYRPSGNSHLCGYCYILWSLDGSHHVQQLLYSVCLLN